MGLFVCPSCRARQEVPDEHVGRKARCKQCRTVGQVTADEDHQSRMAGQSDQAEDNSVSSADDVAADYWPPIEPPPLTAPRKQKKDTSSALEEHVTKKT